ncbi:hypothetical protein NM688_g1782 [Phlebia brevispora]|uniref:Uncharacterized protein n=1 Tax=Phlebia brevispora TaxID=194682 RepID=A0ACC1TAJ2_9APHY|nr:hypothetical protein NM688_g1782 [Phlebia brevispora]
MSQWNATALVVDDRDLSIHYSSGWQQVTDPSGSGDYLLTGSGAGSAGMTASFSFNGTGVEVYGPLGSGYGQPSALFTVDNSNNATFTAPSPQPGSYTSGNLFYRSPPLPDGVHELVITNLNGTSPNVFWLDYILYTPSTLTSQSIGSISFLPSTSLPSALSISLAPSTFSRPSTPSTAVSQCSLSTVESGFSSIDSVSSPLLGQSTIATPHTSPLQDLTSTMSLSAAAITADAAAAAPSSTKRISAGVIAGSVIAGVAFIALVTLLVWFCRKKMERKASNQQSASQSGSLPVSRDPFRRITRYSQYSDTMPYRPPSTTEESYTSPVPSSSHAHDALISVHLSPLPSPHYPDSLGSYWGASGDGSRSSFRLQGTASPANSLTALYVNGQAQASQGHTTRAIHDSRQLYFYYRQTPTPLCIANRWYLACWWTPGYLPLIPQIDEFGCDRLTYSSWWKRRTCPTHLQSTKRAGHAYATRVLNGTHASFNLSQTFMLPFIPRKVAKSLKSKATSSLNVHNITEFSSNSASSSAVPPIQPATTGAVQNVKGKARDTQDVAPPYDDYAALLLLSLTAYALWANPDLRMTIETSDEGYIPLSYLVSESPCFEDADSAPLESALVKAIRMHASGLLDVRMLMSEPLRAAWYGRRAGSGDAGGYEIRLNEHEEVLRSTQKGSRKEWDAKTLYIENIPPQYRSIPGIYHLVLSLLPKRSRQAFRIQHISLPRHHQDKPDDRPKCKGFALVTFADTEDLSDLLKDWPWRQERRGSMLGTKEPRSSENSEAVKFGFKVLAKSQWEKLNEEYLAYRQRLLEEIAGEEESATKLLPVPEPIATSSEVAPTRRVSEPPSVNPDASYPQNCLVFVRNVHPETNKTTLRKLFSQAFQTSRAEVSTEAVDYVDFNKGMNTCFLRLASPPLTQSLISYFSERPIAQLESLDGAGCTPPAGGKAISMELVIGERESLYWGKVPEKVRRQAVAKASMGTDPQAAEPSAAEGERKRKRRRG